MHLRKKQDMNMNITFKKMILLPEKKVPLLLCKKHIIQFTGDKNFKFKNFLPSVRNNSRKSIF